MSVTTTSAKLYIVLCCDKATLSLVCYANAAELCIKAATYTEPFYYWNVCIQFDVYSCVLGLVSMTIRCFIETVIVGSFQANEEQVFSNILSSAAGEKIYLVSTNSLIICK